MVNFRDFQNARSRGDENPSFEKDFRGWFDKKSELEYSKSISYNPRRTLPQPKKREVWDIFYGHNVGKEVCGKEKYTRPVLVLQRWGDVCLVLPLTTGGQENKFHYDIATLYTKTLGPSRIKLSSIETMSIKRFIYKMGVIDAVEFEKILTATIHLMTE